MLWSGVGESNPAVYFFLIFDEYEIEELKTLLGINMYDNQAPLSAGDIDYPFFLN